MPTSGPVVDAVAGDADVAGLDGEGADVHDDAVGAAAHRPSVLTVFASTIASAPTTIPAPLVAILLPTTSSEPPGATAPVATIAASLGPRISLPETRHA